jgi:hypothetical protein
MKVMNQSLVQPYYKQPGDAGREELFAETMSNYYNFGPDAITSTVGGNKALAREIASYFDQLALKAQKRGENAGIQVTERESIDPDSRGGRAGGDWGRTDRDWSGRSPLQGMAPVRGGTQIERGNPYHYGQGKKGGQFAPKPGGSKPSLAWDIEVPSGVDPDLKPDIRGAIDDLAGRYEVPIRELNLKPLPLGAPPGAMAYTDTDDSRLPIALIEGSFGKGGEARKQTKAATKVRDLIAWDDPDTGEEVVLHGPMLVSSSPGDTLKHEYGHVLFKKLSNDDPAMADAVAGAVNEAMGYDPRYDEVPDKEAAQNFLVDYGAYAMSGAPLEAISEAFVAYEHGKRDGLAGDVGQAFSRYRIPSSFRANPYHYPSGNKGGQFAPKPGGAAAPTSVGPGWGSWKVDPDVKISPELWPKVQDAAGKLSRRYTVPMGGIRVEYPNDRSIARVFKGDNTINLNGSYWMGYNFGAGDPLDKELKGSVRPMPRDIGYDYEKYKVISEDLPFHTYDKPEDLIIHEYAHVLMNRLQTDDKGAYLGLVKVVQQESGMYDPPDILNGADYAAFKKAQIPKRIAFAKRYGVYGIMDPNEGIAEVFVGLEHGDTGPAALALKKAIERYRAPAYRFNTYHDPHSGKFTNKPGGGGVGVLEKFPPITAAEARGNSRAVSAEEFQQLADEGRQMIERMKADKAPIDLAGKSFETLKASTFSEVQKPWGGATIDSHTGKPLQSDADAYAISVKPAGLETISVPEAASRPTFDRAMDRGKEAFRVMLEPRQSYLGVFHDDDNHRIDIDPVVVVSTPHEVEAIGAYTHAIGGAYHFKTGDGYFPPHVAEARSVDDSLGKKVHWKGPGEWRSYADRVQRQKQRDQVDTGDQSTDTVRDDEGNSPNRKDDLRMERADPYHYPAGKKGGQFAPKPGGSSLNVGTGGGGKNWDVDVPTEIDPPLVVVRNPERKRS